MFDSYTVKVDMEATGRKIRELRIQKNLKVDEFAEIMHSSKNTIFKWQRGECLPTIDNLLVLSSLFEIPMDDIIQRAERGDEPLFPIIAAHAVYHDIIRYADKTLQRNIAIILGFAWHERSTHGI